MKKALSFLSVLILAGCSFIPLYHRPAVQTPAWRGAQAAQATNLAHWWQRFNNPELERLEKMALAQNLDIAAAAARIRQARADEAIAAAALFPQADLSGNASATPSKTAGQSTKYLSAASGSMSVSYELDLFGANRAAAASARASVQSSVFARRTIALATAASVADAYANVLTLRGRLSVAESTRNSLQKTLRLIELRFKAGASSALEVEQQKTEVANANATIFALQDSYAVALDGLAVLVGEPPQTFQVKADSLSSLHIPEIAPGQPSTLLERRPDIRQAEEDLIASNADIGVARAAFFPSVNIGLAPSITVSPLFSPATASLALTSALSAPLFKGGGLEAGLAKSRAREKELAADYLKTVLTAFQETEDALANLKSAKKTERSYTDAVRSATKAYNLAEKQFKAGAIDYPTLLISQRSLYAAKDNLIAAELGRFTAAVSLYKAVGGAWEQKTLLRE